MNKLTRFIHAVALGGAMLLGASPAEAGSGGGGGTTPTVPAFPQMRSWMFSPNRLDFQVGAAPSVNAVSGATGTNEPTYAAFDEANQPIFYAKRVSDPFGTGEYNLTVFAGNGTPGVNAAGDNVIGSVPVPGVSGARYKEIGNEVAIVPVPGACRQFYLIYMFSSGGSYMALASNIINCSGAVPQIGATNLIYNLTNSAEEGALAVSRENNGTRYIYSLAYGGIRRTPLTSSGFGATVLDVATNAVATEMDLSPDGTRLAFGAFKYPTGLFDAQVNTTTGVVSSLQVRQAPGTLNKQMFGVEFSPDGSKIYYSGGDAFTTDPNAVTGIWQLTLATSQLQLLPNTRGYDTSMIETGYDGLLYTVSDFKAAPGAGRLLTINTSNGTTALSPITTVFDVQGKNVIILPDQIDGEDYTYLFSTAAPTIGALAVSGQTLIQSTASSARVNVFGCSAIPLTAPTTNVAAYQVTLTQTTSTGVLQPTVYQYTTGSLSTLPSDIRTLDNSHLTSFPGYYQIKVIALNTCGNQVQRIGYIRYANAVASASNFRFMTGQSGAALQVPGNASSSPTSVGAVGGGIDFSQINAVGSFGSYQIRIEDLSGNLVADTGPLNATGNTAPYTFRDIVFETTGLSNYFDTRLNQTFRVILTLRGGTCASSAIAGYFRPTTTAYRSAPVTLAPAVLAPNPLENRRGTLTYDLPSEQTVQIVLLDGLSGKQVRVLQAPAKQAAGQHSINVDAEGLRSGLYLYKIVSDNQSQTGRVMVGTH
jgi:hypothetical protein